MTRIAVVGNAGGGKSTLAIALGASLGLSVHHIDRIQFQPGWRSSPPEHVAQWHAEFLATPSWIIDGWGDWSLIQARFDATDMVVVVDLPLYRHLWWALKRQVLHPFACTPDRPENCPLLPRTWQMIRTILHVHRVLRPELRRRVKALGDGCRVVRLRSPLELAAFQAAHCHPGDD